MAQPAPPPLAAFPRIPAGALYRRLDFAYGCFVWVALVVCGVPLFGMLPLSFDTWQALAMLVGLPLAIGAVGGGVTGTVLSVVLWREWPLAIMAVASISMLLLFLGNDQWHTVSDRTELIGCSVATAILFFFCARWFLFRRRQVKRKQLAGADS
ncbi:MAG TPA: hypothetical protein VLX32_07815 [Candidatus Acidoferrum sp.]|nr:hypothetical protein [Candidatus Acidoferrum sp.]